MVKVKFIFIQVKRKFQARSQLLAKNFLCLHLHQFLTNDAFSLSLSLSYSHLGGGRPDPRSPRGVKSPC